ncbi:RluA family pseudouridine synthase [Candidatus Dependentiae bacterium]|nr:RluA family pseudouridine synthase [Candidatus Dependentiae bacterium]
MESLDKNISKTHTLICNESDFESIRIDKYLFSQFPDYSRAYFQNLIHENLISVNSNNKIKCNYKLKKNDTIQVNFPKIIQYDLTPHKIDFEVVDIQDDFIIINKPAGLVVHPSDNNKDELSLVHGLLYKFKELEDFNDEQRPGIVHRIDRGTSGLLIIARNVKSQIKFSNMFKNREIKKTYLAVVKGHPQKEGKISYPIGRHPVKRHLMSHLSYDGKPALTYYKVLQYYKNESLVEIRIITGRTHQIRVHFAAIGHGLIGDDHYGFQSKLINRPALHAHKLEFEFKNQKFEYKKEVPQDFEELLNNLKIR